MQKSSAKSNEHRNAKSTAKGNQKALHKAMQKNIAKSNEQRNAKSTAKSNKKAMQE